MIYAPGIIAKSDFMIGDREAGGDMPIQPFGLFGKKPDG
jgi:hypothetical protein